MLYKQFAVLTLTIVAAAWLVPGRAAAPVKISKAVVSLSDLAAEADARVEALDKILATKEAYEEAKKQGIPQEAGVLAVIAQAVVEHEEMGGWKASAPAVRDAAIKVAKSTTQDDAKAGLAAVKEALKGKGSDAKTDHEWNKLCRLGRMMAESSKRNGNLRRAARELPEDTKQLVRDASLLAVLALVAHDDTHEVKDMKDIPKWKAMAKDMHTAYADLATALKAKNATAFKDGFTKATKTCADCHAVFRSE